MKKGRRGATLLLDLGCPYFHVGRCSARGVATTANTSAAPLHRGGVGSVVDSPSSPSIKEASVPTRQGAKSFASLAYPVGQQVHNRHDRHQTTLDNHPLHQPPPPLAKLHHQPTAHASSPITSTPEIASPSISPEIKPGGACPSPSSAAVLNGGHNHNHHHHGSTHPPSQMPMPAGTTDYERECKYFDINGRQKRGMPQRGDPHHHPEVPKESFFRRELPKHCISFSSDEGKKLFREALGTLFLPPPWWWRCCCCSAQSAPPR